MSDQSQLEIRVLAAIVERYYGDPTLANAYREGRDIHRFNASRVFNKPEEEIVDAERRFSKTISFALLYGSSEKSVSESTGRTPEEVHQLFETFYASFPGVRAYIKSTHEYASKYGCVRTPFGRVKHVVEALDRGNRGSYSRALRQAQNGIIQSTGSDLSLNSIVYADQYIREHSMKSRIVAFVHDSITIDAYPTEWFESYDLLLYSMKTLNEQLDFITCPLGIDVDMTTNMGDHFTIKEVVINEDGSRTFKGKGYDYVIDEILREACVGYDLLQDTVISSKEVVEETGDLIARKACNLSYDHMNFIEQVREITLKPKSKEVLYS
jgi:DNA polymerase-1